MYIAMEIMELVFTTCIYNHQRVTVGQHSYVMPCCQHYMLHIAIVYTKAIKFHMFKIHENTIYQYHDIEVKTISRSNIMIMINIVILWSSIRLYKF